MVSEAVRSFMICRSVETLKSVKRLQGFCRCKINIRLQMFNYLYDYLTVSFCCLGNNLFIKGVSNVASIRQYVEKHVFCFPLKAVLWGMFVKFALPISKLVMLIYIKNNAS